MSSHFATGLLPAFPSASNTTVFTGNIPVYEDADPRWAPFDAAIHAVSQAKLDNLNSSASTATLQRTQSRALKGNVKPIKPPDVKKSEETHNPQEQKLNFVGAAGGKTFPLNPPFEKWSKSAQQAVLRYHATTPEAIQRNAELAARM